MTIDEGMTAWIGWLVARLGLRLFQSSLPFWRMGSSAAENDNLPLVGLCGRLDETMCGLALPRRCRRIISNPRFLLLRRGARLGLHV